jgi:hypothetical protein
MDGDAQSCGVGNNSIAYESLSLLEVLTHAISIRMLDIRDFLTSIDELIAWQPSCDWDEHV